MFIHHFKYTLITLFKNKSLVFWTFAFPIVLSLFFNMAFSGIEENEKLDIMPIAVVNDESSIYHESIETAFEELSDEKSDDQMFKTKYVSEKEAKKLLSQEEIIGYVVASDDDVNIVTYQNGVEETILKYVVDEIVMTTKISENVAKLEVENGNFDPVNIAKKIEALLTQEGMEIKDVSNKNLSYMMIEYYTLIAMTCLYGGVIVMEAMNQSLANMTSIGKRIGVSPTKKSTIVFSGILASYIIQFIGVCLLLAFTKLVLHVDYGDQFGLIFLLCACGTFAGLALGLFISVIVKANENSKVGIIIAVSMAMSVLSGMTGVTLKYLVDTNMPFINQINPASMITDAFYSLYYYATLDRFYMNIASLLIFGAIFMVISGCILRRQKYDSI